MQKFEFILDLLSSNVKKYTYIIHSSTVYLQQFLMEVQTESTEKLQQYFLSLVRMLALTYHNTWWEAFISLTII